MTKSFRTLAVTAVAVMYASLAPASIQNPDAQPNAADVQFPPETVVASVRPPASFKGEWFVSPDGCAYSRSQAPGYAPVWILIQNPHHLGLPDRADSCPTTL